MTFPREQQLGHWRWFIVTGVFYTQFFFVGLEGSRGILVLEFIRHFKESAPVVTWVFTMTVLTGVFSGPVIGYLVSRYGGRRVTLVGALISTVSMGATCFADSIIYLFISFGLISGVGLNCVYVSGFTVVAQYFTDRHAFANGLAALGGCVGVMALPPLVEIMISAYGWRGTFIVLTGFSANLFVSAVIMRPITMRPRLGVNTQHFRDDSDWKLVRVSSKHDTAVNVKDVPEIGRGNTAQQGNDDNISEGEYKQSLDSLNKSDDTPSENKKYYRPCSVIKRLWGFDLFAQYSQFSLLLSSVPFYGVSVLSNPMWIVVHAVAMGISRIDAALLMTYFGSFSVIGRLLHGYFIDRGYIAPLDLLSCMVILSTVFNFTYTFTSNYNTMIAACAVLGFSQGVITTVYVVCTKKLVRTSHLPRAIGLQFALLDSGCLMIPLAGYLLEITSDSRAPLILTDACFAICSIICVTVAIRQRRTERKKRAETNVT
ncbi:monocarboxylate transporter 12-like isoform X2 [Ptychodera flava]|uniref:monocarboxylate transporter 12-like isoform X2 n=1 Tax=Ptychodera flava TaxID=63121 RepID=UPI00396A694C